LGQPLWESQELLWGRPLRELQLGPLLRELLLEQQLLVLLALPLA
jgi:hypothetical protein